MGERFRGSSISGSAVARRQLLVDWARLVHTATVRVEGATRIAVRYGPFCGSCPRLEGWRSVRFSSSSSVRTVVVVDVHSVFRIERSLTEAVRGSPGSIAP